MNYPPDPNTNPPLPTIPPEPTVVETPDIPDVLPQTGFDVGFIAAVSLSFVLAGAAIVRYSQKLFR